MSTNYILFFSRSLRFYQPFFITNRLSYQNNKAKVLSEEQSKSPIKIKNEVVFLQIAYFIYLIFVKFLDFNKVDRFIFRFCNLFNNYNWSYITYNIGQKLKYILLHLYFIFIVFIFHVCFIFCYMFCPTYFLIILYNDRHIHFLCSKILYFGQRNHY